MSEMQHKDYFFEDSVVEFYRYSNEIASFYRLFNDKILPYLNNFKDIRKWLDVGIGDGSKILKLTESLNSKNKPEIDFLEPSNNWINQLIISGNLHKLNEITKTTGHYWKFEDYIKSEKSFNFDLISFIQVVYDSQLLKSILYFIDNHLNKNDYFILINLENENNDLFKIRNILKKNKILTPSSQIFQIEEALSKRKFITYDKFNSNDKKLNDINIGEIIYNYKMNRFTKNLEFDHYKLSMSLETRHEKHCNKGHWFFPFILGCSYSDFIIKYTEKERTKVFNIVSNYLSDKTEININDSTIIAKIKAN